MTEPAVIHVLAGAEREAAERLEAGATIAVASAQIMVRPRASDRTKSGAIAALALLDPLLGKTARALLSTVLGMPGGAKQLDRASRDLGAALRSLPTFPVPSAPTDVVALRTSVAAHMNALLGGDALELHDVALVYRHGDDDQRVLEWRHVTTAQADAALLELVIDDLQAMSESDPYLAMEFRAGIWWYTSFAPDWPNDADAGHVTTRARAWALTDRPIPGLGMTIAEAFPQHERWKSLSHRRQKLARVLVQSASGMFRVCAEDASGVVVESLGTGARYVVVVDGHEETPAPGWLYLGRLMRVDAKRYQSYPGTVVLGGGDVPDEIHEAARAMANDPVYRAPTAEAIVGALAGLPRRERTLPVSREEARALLAHHERVQALRDAGKGFRPRGGRVAPPDDVDNEWVVALRRAIGGDPGQTLWDNAARG